MENFGSVAAATAQFAPSCNGVGFNGNVWLTFKASPNASALGEVSAMLTEGAEHVFTPYYVKQSNNCAVITLTSRCRKRKPLSRIVRLKAVRDSSPKVLSHVRGAFKCIKSEQLLARTIAIYQEMIK